ncbi:MAG: HAD-IIIC family phosphatase [Rhodospirillaceae bacterium]|nr:HAD-IIIC family phosphatase [Rhodospirillaceae bacterium]MBT5374868.1 HAD-IIIC family phosphatase [Rhodospirillaceae bacterium]MBT5659994.1 HAD-IIIC family phosphatase [Rhodospirillaceae bacterium]MBT5751568.1 HAD-IIIC family phosphatase [Rhodospirillaceae bacterium]
MQSLQSVMDPSDKLLVVHSSLVHLGCDPSTAKWALLSPLKELSARGVTIAVPTFTFGFCRGQGHDSRRSPSESGVLGEWVLGLDGACRTAHPIYSFAVIGPQSEKIVACANSTTFGKNSVFAFFEKAAARLIVVGTDWEHCTQFHRYEEEAKVPYRFYKTFMGQVVDKSGSKKTRAKMFVRDLNLDGENDFSSAVKVLRERGEILSVHLGHGRMESVKCQALAKVSRSLLDKDPFVFVRRGQQVSLALKQKAARQKNSPLRLAVLGMRNVSFMADAIADAVGDCIRDRAVDIYTPDYGQLWQDLLDPRSRLHKPSPDIAFFVDRIEDVLGVGCIEDALDRESAEGQVRNYAEAISKFSVDDKGAVIVNMFCRLQASSLGQADTKKSGALVLRANQIIQDVLGSRENVYLFDTAQAAATYSEGPVVDERLWYLGRFPFGRGFSRHLSEQYAGMVLAVLGRTARVLVVDLDNTLWGGILGEDGIENLHLGGDYPGNAYQDMQRLLKRLSERGIAIAICSKNDESHVQKAMNSLENMEFTLKDAVSHRINWVPKWQNVESIAAELNLGLESFAFVDDNPVEREHIRQQLPEVKVIDLPDDPALFAKTIMESPYLGCLSLTAEDKKRAKSYRRRREIENLRGKVESLDEFYASLDAKVHIFPLNEKNMARAVQLMAKTNQFNATTRRYGSAELVSLAEPKRGGVFVIGLEDRFMEMENIGVATIRFNASSPEVAEIDSFLLSCRVLGRGVETAVLHWLSRYALSQGMKSLWGRVIPTERNEPVRGLYSGHGFTKGRKKGEWQQNLLGALKPPPSWVKLIDHVEKGGPNA